MKTNIIKHITFCVATIATSALLSACSDDDKWSAGEQRPATSTGAYFGENSTTSFSTADSEEFEVEVSRLDTAEAATVKINLVSADTATISVDESVVFAKGEATAKLKCRAAGLPAPTTDATGKTVAHYYRFTIAIDEAQRDPYAAGSYELTLTATNGKLWNTLVKDAQWYWASNTALPSWYSDIEQYLDENRFRIKDFLGSGVDWEFKIQSASESLYYGNYTNLDGDVKTWMGSVDFEYDENHSYNYDGSWIYFMPDIANDVYGWKTPGYDLGYASFSCYVGYSYIDFTSNYFQTWAYGYGDDADGTDINGYFYGYWTADKVMK